MQVTMIFEFPASYCHLARGITQVYLLFFFLDVLEVLITGPEDFLKDPWFANLTSLYVL